MRISDLANTKGLHIFSPKDMFVQSKIAKDTYRCQHKIFINKSIIINKGSKQGLYLGMIAMDGEYLVGKVVEVNYLSSRVLLLSDLNSKIPVTLEPDGLLSILSGTGEDHGVIQYTKKYKEIQSQSIIYTSGTSGLFKAGIPIGRINSNFLDDGKKVEFFSDFSQLKFVKVLSFLKSETE